MSILTNLPIFEGQAIKVQMRSQRSAWLTTLFPGMIEVPHRARVTRTMMLVMMTRHGSQLVVVHAKNKLSILTVCELVATTSHLFYLPGKMEDQNLTRLFPVNTC
jgi:hypothetical protein